MGAAFVLQCSLQFKFNTLVTEEDFIPLDYNLLSIGPHLKKPVIFCIRCQKQIDTKVPGIGIIPNCNEKTIY